MLQQPMQQTDWTTPWIDRAKNISIVALFPWEAILKICLMWFYFFDSVDDPGEREVDYPNLRKLEERWVVKLVKLVSLASIDPVSGCNKRDDARAGARHYGTWYLTQECGKKLFRVFIYIKKVCVNLLLKYFFLEMFCVKGQIHAPMWIRTW